MFLASQFAFSSISGCLRLSDIFGCSRLLLDSFGIPSFRMFLHFMFGLSWNSSSSSRFAFCCCSHRFSSVFSLCSVSYSIISGLSVPSFPRNSIFHIPPFPDFSSFMSRHVRKFRLSCSTSSGCFLPSCPIISGNIRFSCSGISGFVRLPPVLAGRKELDPGLFLETEVQQYVLLGTTILNNELAAVEAEGVRKGARASTHGLHSFKQTLACCRDSSYG